jgi:hypothetical protein
MAKVVVVAVVAVAVAIVVVVVAVAVVVVVVVVAAATAVVVVMVPYWACLGPIQVPQGLLLGPCLCLPLCCVSCLPLNGFLVTLGKQLSKCWCAAVPLGLGNTISKY